MYTYGSPVSRTASIYYRAKTRGVAGQGRLFLFQLEGGYVSATNANLWRAESGLLHNTSLRGRFVVDESTALLRLVVAQAGRTAKATSQHLSTSLLC